MSYRIVYQTQPGGEFKVIDSQNAQSAKEVDQMIAIKEGTQLGDLNWYGSTATTPKAAIEEAKANGYSYLRKY